MTAQLTKKQQLAKELYNKTYDIIYVKQQMGHKRIETTFKLLFRKRKQNG